MICPNCGQVHPEGARFCPVTGQPIPQAASRRRSPLWGALGAVLVLAVGVLILWLLWRSPGEEPVVEPAATLPAPGRSAEALTSPEPPPAQSPGLAEATQILEARTATVSALLTQSAVLQQQTPLNLLDPRTPTTAALLTQAAVNLAGTAAAPSSGLAPAPAPAEPYGKIAFTCQVYQNADYDQICLVNADGSGWRQMTDDARANHEGPALSPDGQYILFGSNRSGRDQVYQVDLQGGITQLTDLPGQAYTPAVSPDNRWIAFTYKNGQHQAIWIMGRDGSQPRLLSPESAYDDFDPAWSPDSQAVQFASNRSGSVQLYQVDIDGQNLRQVTQLSELRGRSDWSPDGQTLATYIGPSWQREIVLLDLNGKVLRYLTSGGNNLAPNFSPGGGWIVFTSYRDLYRVDAGCEIYIMPVDGSSEIRRLTENETCDWQPNWGP